MANDPKKDKKSSKGPTPEDIVNGFNALRTEQRSLAIKLSEFEMDLNEHKLVIETLKNVNEGRKCYRLVGGILTERKVKDVLPVLVANKERLTEFIEKLTEQLTKKGLEINEYKEKHSIRIRGQEDLKQEEEANVAESRGNVLVS
ncbi:hypothetical protein AMK59_7775 [Oryctes borbonicus]|uniref:Prefoldin subunit 2 n=1 Tax=Oryctes borbonicus TaxID=1629725 RepID=A0A0T6AYC2_9SCAR|nr:hypothetical protein AMK59_7775 [Oryctes borbonicus]